MARNARAWLRVMVKARSRERRSPKAWRPSTGRGLDRGAAEAHACVMRRLAWLVPVACFLLDPSFACGPPAPQYEYGAAEMRAAVEGNWSFTIMPEGASAPIQVTVKVAQATALPGQQAHAPVFGLVR